MIRNSCLVVESAVGSVAAVAVVAVVIAIRPSVGRPFAVVAERAFELVLWPLHSLG